MVNLIECPVCGHLISENAKSCPCCGEPITPADERPLAMIGTLPVAIACFNTYTFMMYFARLYDNGMLIPTIVYMAISLITLILGARTCTSRYKAHGVAFAGFLISIINFLLGLIVLILRIIAFC